MKLITRNGDNILWNRRQRHYKGKGIPISIMQAIKASKKQQLTLNDLPPEATEQLIKSGVLKEIPQDEVEFAKSCGVKF